MDVMSSVVEVIREVFEKRGQKEYGGESVNQLEHALQCAALAEESKASRSLVLAALLHDIGHIFDDECLAGDSAGNLDDKHEHRGNGWLREHFGSAVADPVRLHVVAKRYLCSVDSDYQKQLSPTSLQSYRDQGGLMSDDERLAFEKEPYAKEALDLRRWDDAAKVPGRTTPPLEHYLGLMEE